MDEVYKMLFKNKSPRDAVSTLLSRTPYDEWKAFNLSYFKSK